MKKAILYIVARLLLAMPFVSADADDFGSCGMGNMMYGSYGSGMMIFSWAFGLLVLIALVLFIIWLVKQIQKK